MHPCLIGLAFSLVSTLATAQFKIPQGLSAEQRARFERFENFQIKGVCGVRDLERLSRFGVNTVRGYTIPSPEDMLDTLDEVHRLGMTMIVSEWMPNHGENKANNGSTWNFDYNKGGDNVVKNFIAKVDAIGDHPAILMWGLGNEVHLDEPYLRVVDRMSRAVHERFPHHITSLTMVNAKPEHIEAIKRFAPDLDVVGVQSYSPGAVRGAMRSMEEHWQRPFYVSEFNGKGPWNFKKTEWDEAFDEPVSNKVADLRTSYDDIDASPLCLGSTVFVWGHFGVNRPTYFSLLLSDNPAGPDDNTPMTDLMLTPQAEVLIERFTGKPVEGNRAPVITAMSFDDGAPSLVVSPDEPVQIHTSATDADADAIRFAAWVLDSKPARARPIMGPFESADPVFTINAPGKAGDYLVMIYAIDDHGGGSATTLPLAVRQSP